MTLDTVGTPALILERSVMERNIARLAARMRRLGVPLRPHLKTVKCIEAARLMIERPDGPATVSTLQEAEAFAAAGITDLLYAVGIAPGKLERVVTLRRTGADLCIVLDSIAQADAVVAAAQNSGEVIPVLIEIDCDGHRSGLRPDDPAMVEVARRLTAGGAQLRGILTHAGESYYCRSPEALRQAAANECATAVAVANHLRSNGFPCPVVSVGSTPTAHFAEDLRGVTEVRAGVYALFDLVMAGIGVCNTDDIALSVLTTVIGARPDKGWIITDAGWMALSRDRGTARQTIDQGYGVVCALDGVPIPDVIVRDASQEHGILAIRPGSQAKLPDMPVGTRLRILPNHACATAGQHDHFIVTAGRSAGGKEIEATWSRIRGW